MADERIEHVASYTGNKYHNQSFLFFLNTEFEPIRGSCEESGNTIETHYFLIYRVKQMNLRLTFRKTASDFFSLFEGAGSLWPTLNSGDTLRPIMKR